MAKTKVINIRTNTTSGYVYIGRPSVWGNPYKIGEDGTREQVIDLYRSYITRLLSREPHLKQELEQLRGEILGCYCKPLPCHGDVLVELLDA